MSIDGDSKIFTDILNYFKLSSSGKFNYISSVKPLNGSLLRHYHRPNLETQIVNPSIVTVHHDLEDSDQSLDFAKFVKQYKQTNLIVCLNTKQQKFLASQGINNTVVIPHGFNELLIKPVKKTKQPDEKIVVGFFSRRYGRKVKGEPYLYELVKRLSPEFFKFIFVGQDRNFDSKYLTNLGFEVECYENLPYSVFVDLYNRIHILLICSLFEGGPANIPEAISSATPIITSPVGMCVDYVIDSENGFFLTGDPDLDSERMIDLYLNPFKLSNLFEGAFSKVGEALSWSQVVEKYEKKYFELINNSLTFTKH